MSTFSVVLRGATIGGVWAGLGGGPIRRGRAAAFWRGGKDLNVAVDAGKGVYYDHVAGEGGGILDLIERVLVCDRRGAVEWLARQQGVALDRRRFAPEERWAWRRRRQAAEAEATRFLLWRRALLDYVSHLRCEFCAIERRVSNWARDRIEDPTVSEGTWTFVFHVTLLAAELGDAADFVREYVRRAEYATLVPIFRRAEGAR